MGSAQPIVSAAASGLGDEPIYAFGRERRMHARAYDYWVSLLRGRRMPCVSDLEPEKLAQFADRSLIVDVPRSGGAPAITHVGTALREDAGIEAERPNVSDIAEGTLLAELLRRLPDITAHEAPVGLEAEFEARDGGRILHRGILLPLANEHGRLTSIYGVMSWRQVAAVEAASDIAAAVSSAIASRSNAPLICAWGDGPSAVLTTSETLAPQPLDQRLATARTWAAVAETDRTWGNVSLYAALGAAYDFMLATREDRLTPGRVVRLVFGWRLNRLDRIRYSYTLAHAERLGLGPGRVPGWLDGYDGGHVAVAKAERRARSAERLGSIGSRQSDTREGLGRIELSTDEELYPLIGRRVPRGFGEADTLPHDHRSVATGTGRR